MPDGCDAADEERADQHQRKGERPFLEGADDPLVARKQTGHGRRSHGIDAEKLPGTNHAARSVRPTGMWMR